MSRSDTPTPQAGIPSRSCSCGNAGACFRCDLVGDSVDLDGDLIGDSIDLDGPISGELRG